jgi:hypothetical protein
MPGPEPKKDPVRRNSRVGPLRLPAEGRAGDPPVWPLPPDPEPAARLRLLNQEIDTAALEAQGDGKEARAAERRLFGLRLRAEVLTVQIAEAEALEAEVWAQLWGTPQAVAWERLGWLRVVARYARLAIAAERFDKVAMSEARQLEDRLGLTPKAMRMLLWEVVTDEVAEKRQEQKASSSRRRRVKAVE